VLDAFPELRLAEAKSNNMSNVAMVSAIDLGDVGGPFTCEHNRAKQEVGKRLLRAAMGLIYARQTAPPWRGPEPKSVTSMPKDSREDQSSGPEVQVSVKFKMFSSKGFYRHPFPLSVLSFEALAAAGNVSYWIPMTMLPPNRGSADSIGFSVTLWFARTATGQKNASIVAIRYAYAAFPTGIMHTLEGLPLSPFLINCSVPLPCNTLGSKCPPPVVAAR